MSEPSPKALNDEQVERELADAGIDMTEPIERLHRMVKKARESTVGELIQVRDRQGTLVYAVIAGESREQGEQAVREHNAHAALVEACEAASEALYAATACGAQSRHEQEQVNEARVKIESALSKARPKGKE